MGGMPEQQKERFSRAFVVAAAAAAAEHFTYVIYADDIEGVDMTVKDRGMALDFQLKATAHPEERDGHLLFDLDIPTYNKLIDVERSGLGILALIVLHEDSSKWVGMLDSATELSHCAYYLILTGLPAVPNTSSIRLKVPKANKLTPTAMLVLMKQARSRFGWSQ